MSNFAEKDKMFQSINEILKDGIFAVGNWKLKKMENYLERKISSFEIICWKDVVEELGKKKLNENFVYQNELKSLKKNCENLRKLYEEERFEKNSIQEGVKTQEKAEIESLNQQILKYREKVAYLN